ncbi:MAG: hypothetical protein OWQ48_06760 [Desulfurococcus sp.]|nr:hypothetical protein [Desulfurococcus sp.]
MNGSIEPENVSEYYFSEHYRVLVVEENGEFTVSVDVYREGWDFTDYTSKCIGDVCLLLKELTSDSLRIVAEGIEGVVKVAVIGVRVADKYETIGVKWVIDRKPGYAQVEAIYKASWKLVGCAREACRED